MKSAPFSPHPSYIFFDVGDVLFNEDRLRLRIFQCLIKTLQKKGHNLTLFELLQEREERARTCYEPFFHYDFAREMLDGDYEYWFQNDVQKLTRKERYVHEITMPGMIELLEKLKSDYKFGIIADQPVETESALEKHGLLHYFEVIGLSAKVGFYKPDTRFFQWALDQAGCPAEEAVMIGDRYEADMAPAKEVGMGTILFIPEATEKGWLPADSDEELYLQIISRTPNWRRQPISRAEKPDVIVKSASEIAEYLLSC